MLSKKHKKQKNTVSTQKSPWLKLNAIIFALFFGFFGVKLLFLSSAASCTVSATLVNSCRPWLGAASNYYPGITNSNVRDQILGHEARIGRQVDVAHDYRGPGDGLSSSDTYFANRANTYLMLNWKPVTGGTSGNQWKDGDGRSATINSNIDTMADSIKSLGSTKIFLALWHEPDDDISPGGSPGCVAAGSATTGKMGSTADYVNMWHNVRARFDAKGVSNVVWVWNPMGYVGHNCDVNDLYPGNSYVDWVVWDPYIHDGKALSATGIGMFYDFLSQNTTGSRAYTSKPWGLNEWGSTSNTPSLTYQGYSNVKAAIDNNTYPKLKMFNIWDSQVPNGTDWRVGYNASSAQDNAELSAYKSLANDPRLSNEYYTGGGSNPPPTDTTSPTVHISSPSTGASFVPGNISVSVSATDNVGVTKVELYADGKTLSSDSSAPYAFVWDASGASVGSHDLSAKAYDGTGNIGQSSVVSITLQQPPSSDGGGGGGSSGTPTPVDVTKTGSNTADSPLPVSGKIILTEGKDDKTVSVKIDDKEQSSGTIDTNNLTNGIHKVTVESSDGKTKNIYIKVKNPWNKAFVNELRAHPVAYSASGVGIIVVLAALFLSRSVLGNMIYKFKTRKYVHF